MAWAIVRRMNPSDRVARALDRLLDAACDKALANARDEAEVRADNICVMVLIPLSFRVADIGAAGERLMARAPRDSIKKFASAGMADGAWRCVIEPYQSLVPEGPNYLPSAKRGAL